MARRLTNARIILIGLDGEQTKKHGDYELYRSSIDLICTESGLETRIMTGEVRIAKGFRKQ